MSRPQRLPSGRWRIRWIDHTGQRLSDTFDSRSGAVDALDLRRAESKMVRAGLAPPPPAAPTPAPAPEVPTFAAFVEEFMRTYVAANNKRSEQVAKERIFRTILLPAFGPRRLDEIDIRAVEDLKARMLTKGQVRTRLRETGYERKTVNNALIVLRRTLSYAKEVGALVAVPTIKALKTAAPAFDFLDFDEYSRLVADAKEEPRAMILAAGDAGLRSGELRALTWDDVDLRAARVTVRWNEYHGTIDTPKGGRPRTVDMTARLVEAMRTVRHLRGDLVFSGPAGELLTEKESTCALWRVCKRAGLRQITWHVLRHTFCSHLAMRGAPARAIQELAGHANLSTTQRYMHLSPNSTRQAIDLLERPAPEWPRGGHAAENNSK